MLRLARIAAQPVLGLTVRAVHDIGAAVLGQQVQVPVHRRQPDVISAPTYLVEHFLGGPEPVGVTEHLGERGGLARIAHPSDRSRLRFSHSSIVHYRAARPTTDAAVSFAPVRWLPVDVRCAGNAKMGR